MQTRKYIDLQSHRKFAFGTIVGRPGPQCGALDRIVQTTAGYCAPEMLPDDFGDVLGLFDWDSLLSREHDVT